VPEPKYLMAILLIAISYATVAAQKVSRVIDGDTIQLEDGSKVRYAGINAPEEGEIYWREASQANNLLVGNKEVELEFGRRKTDEHGRLLAYVYVGRVLVQAELVKQGWAFVTRAQPLRRHLELLTKLQEEAKAAGRGIWAKGDHRNKLTVIEVHPRQSRSAGANDEYVVFKNVGDVPLNMTGWSVSDETNRSYLIPQFMLKPGENLTLYTGTGKNTNSTLYWGLRRVIWNKSGDTVIVKDDTGHYVTTYTYGPQRSSQ
jgi:micrococcal nuclease